MSKVTIKEATAQGTLDGIEAAETLWREQGIDNLRKCQSPGHDRWDESAIIAGAFELSCHVVNDGTLERARRAYYSAYEFAASKRAEELIAESEAQG